MSNIIGPGQIIYGDITNSQFEILIRMPLLWYFYEVSIIEGVKVSLELQSGTCVCIYGTRSIVFRPFAATFYTDETVSYKEIKAALDDILFPTKLLSKLPICQSLAYMHH